MVDLTVILNEQTPAYPGDSTVKIEQVGVLEKDGYVDHYVSMGTHIGTHIDAPMHMIKAGKKLNQFPVEKYVGRGRYIKMDKSLNVKTLQRAGISVGDIVLFHTGMSDRYFDTDYYEDYPTLTEEVAHYLVAHKVKMIGLDTGSADILDGFPVHKILLGGEV